MSSLAFLTDSGRICPFSSLTIHQTNHPWRSPHEGHLPPSLLAAASPTDLVPNRVFTARWLERTDATRYTNGYLLSRAPVTDLSVPYAVQSRVRNPLHTSASALAHTMYTPGLTLRASTDFQGPPTDRKSVV